MFEAKEKFLDRIEQSFVLLKNNFVPLAVPYLLFSIIFLALLPAFGVYVFGLSFPLENLASEGNPLTDINLGIAVTYGLTLGLIYILAYLFALMLVQIGTIVGIKKSLKNEAIIPKENILGYAYKNLGNVFRTYWYIFAYVALIPATLFILGGLLFVGSMTIFQQDIIKSLSIFLMGLSVIVFLVFSIYRGLKSTFALSYAVEKESFTKENFEFALSIVDKKWWRVFGNLFFIGVIGGLVTSLITNLTNALGLVGKDYAGALSSMEGKDTQGILESFQSMGDVSVLALLSTTLNTLAGAILGVFMMVFLYIFMLRLEKEKLGVTPAQNEKQEEKVTEL